jgi:cyclin-dependent kinase 12/13
MAMDKEIGAGRYGTVFKTTDKETGKRFALKHIKMEGETQGFPVTAIREIKILKALDHENIIKLEEVITYGNEKPDDEKESGELVHTQDGDLDLSQFLKGSVFMVFEYVEFDLSALILSMNNMTPAHIKCYMKQLLSGIFYMHRQKILHRDLKTANILITRGNVLKIADWGLARSVFAKLHRLSPVVVTLWYRSPELLLETKKYVVSCYYCCIMYNTCNHFTRSVTQSL